jgi:uncharacterized protein
MDALRGFAILGIFIVNLSGLSLYDANDTSHGWHFGALDRKMFFLHHVFLEGKFYSIFSLLFGWGLALQIKRTRSELSTIKVSPIIIRRLIVMFLIGLIHLMLIWSGDIIALYALIGFVLLSFRRISPRGLLILGTVSILAPVLVYGLRMHFPVLNKPSDYLVALGESLDQKLLGISKPEEFANLLRNGSLTDLIIYNFDGAFFRFGDLIFQSRFFKVLGMFLVGYSLGISGYFKILLENRRMLLIVVALGLTIGLPANYLLAEFMRTPANYRQSKIEGLYQTIVYAVGVAPLALAYVCLLALTFRNRVWHRIMKLFMPVGKMALTNYIFHSVSCLVVFYGVGFGLMGTLGPIAWTVYALVVFVCQIIFSTLWLQFFQFGPLEWIWRSLTYGKIQPISRDPLSIRRTSTPNA